MVRIIVLGAALAFATAASAQLYRWVDKDGKVHYTSTPPPAGVQSRTLEAPSGAAAPAPASDSADAPKDAVAKDAPKGPLAPAEQEAEFRKRRLEAQKAEEKAAAAAKDQAVKQTNCQRAKEGLATLQSGQRILRTNTQGEQYYLDDSAREREIQNAQRAVQDWCN